MALLGLSFILPVIADSAGATLSSIDFNQALMNGMLGFLLFAGALHVNLDDLLEHKAPIPALVTLGLLLSTAIVGALSYALALRGVSHDEEHRSVPGRGAHHARDSGVSILVQGLTVRRVVAGTQGQRG